MFGNNLKSILIEFINITKFDLLDAMIQTVELSSSKESKTFVSFLFHLISFNWIFILIDSWAKSFPIAKLESWK